MSVADEPVEVSSTDFTPQRRPSLVRKLLERIVKPKPLQSIPSGTISVEQRDSALAPFTITGVAVGQVNRNYDAFFKSAWGSSPTSAPKTSAANLPQPSVSSAVLIQPPDSPAGSEHREEKVAIGYHMHGTIVNINLRSNQLHNVRLNCMFACKVVLDKCS